MRAQVGRNLPRYLTGYHCRMTEDKGLELARKFCGIARFDRYLTDTGGDFGTALSLCKWNHRFAGVLHEQIGYVEICVRNAIDRQLKSLALAETGYEDWTNPQHMPDLVSKTVKGQIRKARDLAQQEKGTSRREITHDDVVSKLMWGTWSKIVGNAETTEKTEQQQALWRAAVSGAFPNAPQNEQGRLSVARNLAYLRSARNKAAHFDNLSTVSKHKRRVINASFYLLSSVDKSFVHGWFDASVLRAMSRERQSILQQCQNEGNVIDDTSKEPTIGMV